MNLHKRDTKIANQMKKDTKEFQKLSKVQAVKELEKCSHCFLSPEGIKQIGMPFNVYKTIKMKDNRSEFKGLNAGENHKEGDSIEGIDASVLAEMICDKEGVEYMLCHGRGSQLGVCCKVLLKHLGEDNDTA